MPSGPVTTAGFRAEPRAAQDPAIVEPDLQLVMDRELAMLSFPVRRSARQVDELLDPDFSEIGSSGRLWTRAEMMSALAGELSEEACAIEATEMAGVVVGPELVLLTYVSDRRGRRVRRSSLWRRSAGSWRLLHHQGTLLRDL
jgi:hypothetical protein